MTQPDPVRVGFIGAGGICRDRHLPGLAKLPGVQVTAVSNRTRASAEKVAATFGIPQVEDDWRRLIDRPDIDAVFIGAWPYMHRAMSIAALEAGKHVFCQARMCMDLVEARQMVKAATAHPRQVNMICPPPTRMPFEDIILKLIQQGELGELTSVLLSSVNDVNLKSNQLHWRENVAYSGRQIMAVGIYAETLNAWVGDYETLSAEFGQVIHRKIAESGNEIEVRIPQVVAIHGTLARGIVISEFHSGAAAGQTPGDWIGLHGTHASLRYRMMSSRLELCRAGEEPRSVPIPTGHPMTVDDAWTVEADFIEAVRAARAGRSWRVSPDFAEGLRYMLKMEAVHRSAQHGRTVALSEL
ncbi:MAG: Gfo/Idh/MocA family oxidoreductase [Phycisphaeraceae bacterium]|nr:Gfo/Idh/MocA family oxidoreductase [Phycisphaeraceae bacterium]